MADLSIAEYFRQQGFRWIATYFKEDDYLKESYPSLVPMKTLRPVNGGAKISSLHYMPLTNGNWQRAKVWYDVNIKSKAPTPKP